MDTHEGLGFLTVAMVWTRKLRPMGFPEFLGQDFLLAGYRVFTRLRDESGRRLRGLKIIRSETDKRRMVWAGNLLTAYNYRHVHARATASGSETTVETSLANGTRTVLLTFGQPAEGLPVPAGSPFRDWHGARLFAGPMPFTFSPRADGRFVGPGNESVRVGDAAPRSSSGIWTARQAGRPPSGRGLACTGTIGVGADLSLRVERLTTRLGRPRVKCLN